ncbi:hypothetical protein L2E82_22164 [Cichorium intybus]|uniref:Uncharacterized protein n=1 Tax=Cichorium intybus TaxID=13427 RepID=A0ACB9DWN8_CICIN|nr:hypothetical protein L2E82_22164 [Cichorium intybus]
MVFKQCCRIQKYQEKGFPPKSSQRGKLAKSTVELLSVPPIKTQSTPSLSIYTYRYLNLYLNLSLSLSLKICPKDINQRPLQNTSTLFSQVYKSLHVFLRMVTQGFDCSSCRIAN